MLRVLLLMSLSAALIAPSIRADGDGVKKKDPPAFPPAPQAVPAPAPVAPLVIVMPYQRTDTREVWQYYAPNRMGRMVPRVVMTPYGSYYARTLQPFPWAGVQTTAVLPIAVDQASFGK